MDGGRGPILLRLIERTLERLLRVVAPGKKNAPFTLDGLAQSGRQCFIRFMHIGETGVAAIVRNFDAIESSAQRRSLLVGQVRMPHRAAVREADVFAVLTLGRYQEHFGKAVEHGIVGRMLVQRPKSSGEIDLCLRRKILIAENQDVMVEMGTMDPRKSLVVHRHG